MKPSKCHFGKKKVELLGYVVSEEGRSSNPEKVKVIREMSPPTTVKAVRSLLGMTGYYRSLIQGYADLAAPLTELTRKNQRFVWTERHQKSFEQLREALITTPILAPPRLDKPYRLYTDASDLAVGGILVQQDKHGVERVIQYVSKALSETQKRWATCEKECYAVVYCIQKLRTYLV